MGSKLILLFLTLSYIGLSAQNRLLEGWDDPNCS